MSPDNADAPLILLEVIAGPLDGLRFEGRQSLTRLGRSSGVGPGGFSNDLVLGRDSYASSFHATLSLAEGRWWLKDENSTNGTWLAGAKLDRGQTCELQPGDAFVAGNSVVRFRTEPSGLPPIDPDAQTSLSPAATTMINRARTSARDRQVPWIGTASLFRALAESEAPPLPEFFSRAGLDPAQTVTRVDEWSPWQGDLAWIANDILRTKTAQERMMRGVLPTPRLQLIMTLADRIREAARAPHTEPIHLLQAIFAEKGGRVCLALAEAGHPPEPLAALARSLAGGVREAPAPAPGRPERAAAPPAGRAAPAAAMVTEERERKAPPAPAPPAAPVAPPRRPVDPESWLLARELMDRLQAVQGEFHLADPQVRLEALCGALSEGLQKAPPAKRPAVVELLYMLFPVLEEAIVPPPASLLEATPPSIKSEPVDSNKTINTEDEHRREAVEEGDFGIDTGKLFQVVFGDEHLAQTMREMGKENPFLRLTQHLYTFALDMERLAKGLVQSVQGGGGSESRYFLPFTVQDLKMMIQKLLAGNKDEAVMEIRRYLYDLGHWIIAIVAAHQKAASQWNREMWERINPMAIRNEAKVSSLNKALGLGKADLWQTYERVARDLKPEITEDQLNEKIGRLATEEFRRLSARQ
ncbi:MAG: FHA domain-containing protein [bacterium]|nr:FHA domain-containing protein [bacterium]